MKRPLVSKGSESSKVLLTNNQIYLTLPPCWGNGGGMGWGGGWAELSQTRTA